MEMDGERIECLKLLVYPFPRMFSANICPLFSNQDLTKILGNKQDSLFSFSGYQKHEDSRFCKLSNSILILCKTYV